MRPGNHRFITFFTIRMSRRAYPGPVGRESSGRFYCVAGLIPLAIGMRSGLLHASS
jgi:hypothetical protein